MLKVFFLSAAIIAFASPAGAAGSSDAAGREADPGDPAPLLAAARAKRSEEGCSAAAPLYRVVAAMGEGREAAQHELGECLLSASGSTETETALLRDEGLFWLTRAAHAGNARAQRALAIWYGAGDNPRKSAADALKWALVYSDNPEAELYGFQRLPATFEPGLRNALPPDDVAKAEAAARSFTPVTMAAFEPPKIERPKGALEGRPDGPPAGGRRPRRRP